MYKYVLAGLLFGSCGMIMAAAQPMDIASDDEAMLPEDCTRKYFEGLVALYSAPQDTATLIARVNDLHEGAQSSDNMLRLYALSNLNNLIHKRHALTAHPHLRMIHLRGLRQLNPAFDEFYKARFPDPAADSDSE